MTAGSRRFLEEAVRRRPLLGLATYVRSETFGSCLTLSERHGGLFAPLLHDSSRFYVVIFCPALSFLPRHPFCSIPGKALLLGGGGVSTADWSGTHKQSALCKTYFPLSLVQKKINKISEHEGTNEKTQQILI